MRKNKSLLLFPLSLILLIVLIWLMSCGKQRKDNASEKEHKIYVSPSSVAEEGEDKWAVIIGVNNYKDPIQDLEYAVADAQGVYELLVDRDYGGFDAEKVKLLTDESEIQPTRSNILIAMESIQNTTDSDDIVFLFLLGHSIEEDRISYFLPIDADILMLAYTGIPMEWFIQVMKKTEAKVKMIFFDVCYSGANKNKPGSGQISKRTFSRIFTKSEGLAIFSSCEADEESYEYPEKKHGVFTYYLLEALNREADDNDDGFVTVSETARYVTDKVKEWASNTGKKQNPRLDYNVSGEIVLTLSREEEDQPDIRQEEEELPAVSTQTGQSYIRQKDGMKMVLIPAGTFIMGDETGDLDGTISWLNIPQHEVYVDSFYMDEHEVTNEQYCKFLNSISVKEERKCWYDSSGNKLIYYDPSYYKIEKIDNQFIPIAGYEDHPVVELYWLGAYEYVKWVGGRLPTEAEWERAARGGLVGKKYPNGDSISHNDANYKKTGGKDKWEQTAPVKSFPPNAYGLYDMAGNVYEWCADHWDPDYYKESPKNNPPGPLSKSGHVVRGGSWYNYPKRIRCAFRGYLFGCNYVGFRVVVPSGG